MTTAKAKREYKESAHWDNITPTAQFQFEQLCIFMWGWGYITYNKHFTFVHMNPSHMERYCKLDTAVALYNSFSHLPRSGCIEKVRLEKHKAANGKYFLTAFDKVKFKQGYEHLAKCVIEEK